MVNDSIMSVSFHKAVMCLDDEAGTKITSRRIPYGSRQKVDFQVAQVLNAIVDQITTPVIGRGSRVNDTFQNWIASTHLIPGRDNGVTVAYEVRSTKVGFKVFAFVQMISAEPLTLAFEAMSADDGSTHIFDM